MLRFRVVQSDILFYTLEYLACHLCFLATHTHLFRKNTGSEHHVRVYYLLNHQIRYLLSHYYVMFLHFGFLVLKISCIIRKLSIAGRCE